MPFSREQLRRLKGSIVERIEHPKTKRQGVIRLDKRTMTFFARENDAELLMEPFANSSGVVVKQWLLEQLKRTSAADKLDWIPVVKVKVEGEARYRYRGEDEIAGEQVSVEIDRFWIALTQDKREWRKLNWLACAPDSSSQIPENDRYAESQHYGEGPKSLNLTSYTKPFRFPSFENYKAILPYTPELWTALKLMVKTIKEARSGLLQLITTQTGVAHLTEIGAGRGQLLLTKGGK